MTLAERLLLGLAVAATVVYAVTPYMIMAAGRMGFYDIPAGYKGHGRPTPYLGGAAVMAGFVIAVLVSAGDWQKTAPLVGGVALLWVVGTIDDRRTLSPGLRVLVELGMAVLVWAVGLGWKLHVGSGVDLGLTCLWVLGIVNAFNLFDNMDGAASTMALVVAAGAALLGIIRGDAWLAVAAASLGGACLGFLPRNISKPARIFLGDGGSMPLGFAVAVLVLAAARASVVAWQSLLIALLLVGIPALDTGLVVVSRRRRGAPLMTGGRDHLTHRARAFLPSARAVALALGGLQAVVSVVAILASEGKASFVVISAILYVLAAGAAIVLLESRAVEEFAIHGDSAMRAGASPERSTAGSVILALLGLGAGLSPFFFAYYSSSVWVPIGLGLVLASAAGVVARPLRATGPAALALGGLFGLGVWSLASTAWAESVENAVVSGNRWLLYGGLLLLMLVLVRSERRSAVLLGSVALGVTAVAVSVLARILGSDPATLFLGGRLNSPLGYINGEGCLFVMAFWLSMATVQSRRGLVAGPAAGLATLMACLALLSQSRGTALAMLGSLIVVVALAPGRTRLVYGLLVVAAGVAAAAPDLLQIYDHGSVGAIPLAVAHAGGRAALLSAVAVGVAWTLLTTSWQRVRSRAVLGRQARTAGSWLLVAPVVVALVVAAGSADRIGRDLSNQWHAFVHLADAGDSGAQASTAGQSRLLSGGGNRYDYWRIAWADWLAHPVLGVGAGNYPVSYYQLRATTEDIEQPHSIELQALSELGLVGGLLLAAFIAGVGWGAVRMRRHAARSPLSQALMVGGLGVFIAWLVQTSVDWMQLLPGLTAIGLAGVAVLVAPRRRLDPGERTVAPSRLRRTLASRPALALGASAVIVTLVVAGASLSREGLAEIYLVRAQNEVDAHPAAALTDAIRSLDFDSDDVQTYYIKSAALAHFDQVPAAEAALKEALAREPDNFVTWALLGDIAVRDGKLTQARRDYARAHLLDPRDPTLKELELNPRSALDPRS